eukprot:TRINITY_DN1122_c0_g1_i15.p1 TRINITY_DN1122_c0_g1~~TRINITY_DN1122_c0_g1_i15.p1  ORF type:complete len:239 (-),score=57.43 TRINITY_DN1122_c0_g1_i15:99-815(-)
MCIRDRYMGIYIYLEIAINISQNPDFVMQLTRADSTVVSSTHQYESTIIPAPPGKLWTYIRNFALDKVLPSRVDKIEYVEGSAGKVDSVLKISFKDSASWSIKILELSDLNHYITYEVIEASPPIPATSILNTIRLRRVTDDNSTFLTWETDFSNDADANVIQDNKYKKLECKQYFLSAFWATFNFTLQISRRLRLSSESFKLSVVYSTSYKRSYQGMYDFTSYCCLLYTSPSPRDQA